MSAVLFRKQFVFVPRPESPLEPSATLPALESGNLRFEGFFDESGTYYERITQTNDGVQYWIRLRDVSLEKA